MEYFFKRLESYTEVTPTAAMIDIITKIMAEIITIFGIATKELRRGSTSESLLAVDRLSLNFALEKLLKKLARNTDLEDALRRLDKLTQEWARMAAAEVLELTHIVDSKVTAVDKVTTVINGMSPHPSSTPILAPVLIP